MPKAPIKVPAYIQRGIAKHPHQWVLTELYTKTRNKIAPGIEGFTRHLFAKHANGRVRGKLVFIGRDARLLYHAAKTLAKSEKHSVTPSNIKLVDISDSMANSHHAEVLRDYLRSAGVLNGEPLTFVDTGYTGSVTRILKSITEDPGPLGGRGIKSYEYLVSYRPSSDHSSPPRGVPNYGRDKLVSLIEDAPKSVRRVDTLMPWKDKVFPDYEPETEFMCLRANIATRAVIDHMLLSAGKKLPK